MSKEEHMLINAGDYSPYDLGVVEIGRFNADGGAEFFTVEADSIDYLLPRFLLKEPVIHLSNPGWHVYLRGLYSKKLSTARRKAMTGR